MYNNHNMKHLMTVLSLAVLLGTATDVFAKTYSVTSPDGKLKVSVEDGVNLSYSLEHSSELLISGSQIGMTFSDGSVFGENDKVKKVIRDEVRESVPALYYKKAVVEDVYNQIILKFREFDLEVRAYNSGMAYRFISGISTQGQVLEEKAVFGFAQNWNMWAAYVCQHTESLDSQFYNSFENRYEYSKISDWNKERMAFLPLLVDGPGGRKIAIAESDLTDYPGMYLYNGEGNSSMSGRYAPYPKDVRQGGHNNLQMEVVSRENYIAKTKGNDSFPWRIVSVSENDVEMADNDLVYLLGKPADASYDWSWVKPGKVAWEWWNNWNIYGVDFKAGINDRTYEYYIDFASENGIEYVILDEGWCVKGTADLFEVVPEIDLEHLVEYAAERNVGLILWAGYWAFDRDMENICRHYSDMGIKGFKIDFMDRDDQYMVSFHKRAAEMAAKYHLMLDFHGTYKPAGLDRTYPNVLNYEGVHGIEQMKWSDADVDQVVYDVTMPYIRMMAGPLDYTQGAMRNASKGAYRPVYKEPMSQGTRCRQLAEYVIFDSPLNMLCDSPSNYMQEKECTKFISDIPTTWDETRGIDGKVGEYIAMARRKGDVWYVGAMTDWTSRTLSLDLSFLPEGEYVIEYFRDGANAHKAGRDFKKVIENLPESRCLKVQLAPGGGFAAKITLR